MYILRQGQKYIAADEPELRLHRSILECPNKGVRNDADMIHTISRACSWIKQEER